MNIADDPIEEVPEVWLARRYCSDQPYYKAVTEESGRQYRVLINFRDKTPSRTIKEFPIAFPEIAGLSFSHQNLPQHWLKVVEAFTQQPPSDAAKHLHKRVEAARELFRVTQGNIYCHQPDRQEWRLPDKDKLANCYKREDDAWALFNARKSAALKAYLRELRTGVAKRKRRRSKPCAGEGCDERIFGRKKYCEICLKASRRAINSRYWAEKAVTTKTISRGYKSQKTAVLV